VAPDPPTKGGYGFSPLACFLDATNEALAMLLRPGNRAPHNADDHIEVLELAEGQRAKEMTMTSSSQSGDPHILVGVDGSASSITALNWAAPVPSESGSRS
jgi:hypothetical protein